MTLEDKKIIDYYMGVEGIMIDSSFFSPQRRKRYYWTNIRLQDIKEINKSVLGDILNKKEENYKIPLKYYNTYKYLKDGEYWKHLPDDNVEKKHIINTRKKHKNPGGQTGFWKIYDKKNKSPTLTASGIKQKMTRFVIIDESGVYRYPSPVECERLQGLPDNYTDILSDNNRYKAIGNGWNVNTIEYLLKNIE